MMDYLDRVSYTKLATNLGKDLWYKTTWKHESQAANHQEYEMYSRTKRSRFQRQLDELLRGLDTVKSSVNGVNSSTHFRIENG
jgi:hypothetical protein